MAAPWTDAQAGRLLGGLVHELNGPLSGIFGYAQLLERRTDLPADAHLDLRAILADADRMATLLKSAQRAARAAPGERLVDANALVRDALALRAYGFRTRGITVASALAEPLPPATGDPHRVLHGLLWCLAAATAATAAASAVRVETAVAGGRVRVRIVGAEPPPPGDGPEPGWPAVVAACAEGGAALARQDVGGVELSLPVAAVPVAAAPAPVAAAVGPRHVLVVEDEPSLRDLLAKLLELEGHTVTLAPDGEAALAALDAREPDLVICDIHMPRLDGASFFRRACADHPARAARFLFVTGDTVSAGTRAFLDSCGARHLAKPFRLPELLQVATGMLRGTEASA